jgi:pimeloyl-ACP methyl ester carboxylesterase
MQITANGISIEVQDTGTGREAVLLVMGLGMQLTAWPLPLIDSLSTAGYRVITMDNRDIGLSQHFDALGVPNLLWASFKHRFGMPIHAPYTLHDMAQDALGVLDALGIAKAHIVGASMGGMIAQRIALAAPQRVLSLTSVMSTSGAKNLPGPKPHVLRALMSRPMGQDVEAIVAHYVRLFGIIGSPGFPVDADVLKDRMRESVRRSYHPQGTARQMVAVAADSQRADALRGLRCPTLVLHGKADPLVPYACGEDTALRIAGARLVGIEGMGHDFAPGAVSAMLPHLLAFLQSHATP